MYHKFLFVGLGGSGYKTLCCLRDQLRGWQRDNGISDPLPKGWQFVTFDTRRVPDDLEGIAPPLPDGDYVSLIGQGIDLAALQGQLDANKALHEDIAGWRTDPAGPLGAVPLREGAGMYRAIGCTVALASANTITGELQRRLRLLGAADTEAELRELYSRVTDKPPGPASNLHIVVVSSLAGGTGAGLLNIVCDILRSLDDAGSRAFAILYTPEVFDSLDNAIKDGIPANTLAAVSELMNSTWRSGNDPVALDDPTLAGAGLIARDHRRGPSHPFLVGRQNMAGIDHGTHDRVFGATGRSLVSWVTDEAVRERLLAYFIAQYPQAQDAQSVGEILVDAGGDDRGLPQFLALGFARLSIGTEYLENYIVKRIARDANDQVVNYNTDSDEAKGAIRDLGTIDRDTVSRAIAANHLDFFLRQAGISELGTDENQIIDALRPSSELEQKFVQRSLDLAGVGGDADDQTATDWITDITQAVERALEQFHKDYLNALVDSTCVWVPAIEARIVSEVESQIALRGLHVTKSICEIAAEHLATDVNKDLQDEATLNRDWFDGWKRAVPRQLDGFAGKIAADHPDLEEAVREAVHLAKYVGEEQLKKSAAALCGEVAARVLRPLADALSDAYDTAAGDAIHAAAWPAWTDASPPKEFEPPATEFTLITAKEFPDRFNSLLVDTMLEHDSAEERQTELRNAVIRGDFLKDEPGIDGGEYNGLRCVRVQRHWWPYTGSPLNPSRNAAKLRVLVQTDSENLQQRAERWLRRRHFPFERFLRQGIRSYLGGEGLFVDDVPEAEITERRRRFFARLRSAVAASDPLVDLSPALLGKVHPGADSAYDRVISEIPLQGHAAQPELEDTLAALQVPDSQAAKVMTNSPTITHVDITSHLAKPVSMLAVGSLLKPIAGDWTRAAGNPARRKSFWTGRRAKRLDKFVPVPQALLLCLIRGWFTGVALGRIDKGQNGGPARISRHGDGSAASFPYPPLSLQDDPLAKVLEAVSLAYVEVSRVGNLSPLDPYKELRDLGRCTHHPEADLIADLYEYERPNWALRPLIYSGDVQHNLVSPILPRDMLASGEPAERAGALAAEFEACREGYDADFQDLKKQWSMDPRKLSKAPLWTGIRLHISEALNQLENACRQPVDRDRPSLR